MPPIHSCVVTQPSSKIDYAILGEGAGPSKLAAIKKHGLTTLCADEFLNLLVARKGPGGKDGQLDEKSGKKMEKERREIEESAKEVEREESIVCGGESTPFFPLVWSLFWFYYVVKTEMNVCRAQRRSFSPALDEWVCATGTRLSAREAATMAYGLVRWVFFSRLHFPHLALSVPLSSFSFTALVSPDLPR
jgi:hypothetical protein